MKGVEKAIEKAGLIQRLTAFLSLKHAFPTERKREAGLKIGQAQGYFIFMGRLGSLPSDNENQARHKEVPQALVAVDLQ